MVAATTPKVTICPPMPAQNAVLDVYSHIESTLRKAVRVDFRGGDIWENNGFDFGDYTRCSTQTKKKLESHRRLPAPDWALNPEKLRALLVRQMELRAGFKHPQPGTELERLRRAQASIAHRIPEHEETLTGLCKRLVALKANPQTNVRRLAVNIEGLDSFLLLARKPDRGAGALARIAILYFSNGLDSVAVAAEVGMKPPAVRAQIFRMRQVWERMQKEAPAEWRPRIHINMLRRWHPTHLSLAVRRGEIVRSSKFQKLFEEVHARMHGQRSHCKNGHRICAANAHIGDLRRIKQYMCNPCWVAQARVWNAKKAAQRRARAIAFP